MTVRAVLLLRRAARLCGATVAWNLTVGGAAIATALLTGSLSLIGFGINAVVDSSVSSLLVWRFRRGTRARRAGDACRAVGCPRSWRSVHDRCHLCLCPGCCGARQSWPRKRFAVWDREALASLVVLPYLAVGKYRLSVRLGSRALRADSLLTVSGVALATIALMGLILQRTVGWWWADPVAALVIAVFLAVQGAGALREAPEAKVQHASSS